MNKKIKRIKEKCHDFVIYCDTDSVAGNSIVMTDKFGKKSLNELFEILVNDNNNEYISDITGREFVFPYQLKLPFYSNEDKRIQYGEVDYIEKHRVKKELFEITTESGKKIVVTDDHSIMVDRDDKLVEIKANELKKDDTLICMLGECDLTYIKEKIKTIKSLGVCDEIMYDVGMVDTPNTFFANDILVHNSIFCSALPLIQQKYKDVDIDDDKQMTPKILEVTKEVQQYVNDFYDIMAKKMFNIENHRFDIKQEVVAKTSMWLAKKRYCQFIINNGGVEVDELEVKGLDVVRTSFPIKFKIFMQEFIQDILRKQPKERVIEKLCEFKKNFNSYPIIEIAKNTSVKFLSADNKHDYNPKDRTPFNFVKGTPAQVKAALYYNDFLKKFELNTTVEPILHGQKIKWVYLKQNEYGIECMALKADDTDPEEILDFINQYIDRNAMFEQELKGKLKDFYDVLGWDFPSDSFGSSSKFFNFS